VLSKKGCAVKWRQNGGKTAANQRRTSGREISCRSGAYLVSAFRSFLMKADSGEAGLISLIPRRQQKCPNSSFIHSVLRNGLQASTYRSDYRCSKIASSRNSFIHSVLRNGLQASTYRSDYRCSKIASSRKPHRPHSRNHSIIYSGNGLQDSTYRSVYRDSKWHL
jgi:hypothetical protein